MNPHAEYVLLNPFNPTEPMNRRTLQDRWTFLTGVCGLLIPDREQKDGVYRNKYPFHSLRHNCGTNLKRLGMPLEFIKDFLGHSNIQTTLVYIDLVKDDLRVELNKGCKRALELNGYAPKAPKVRFELDRETLLLQKDILEKQLELAKMQRFGGVQYEAMPEQTI